MSIKLWSDSASQSYIKNIFESPVKDDFNSDFSFINDPSVPELPSNIDFNSVETQFQNNKAEIIYNEMSAKIAEMKSEISSLNLKCDEKTTSPSNVIHELQRRIFQLETVVVNTDNNLTKLGDIQKAFNEQVSTNLNTLNREFCEFQQNVATDMKNIRKTFDLFKPLLKQIPSPSITEEKVKEAAKKASDSISKPLIQKRKLCFSFDSSKKCKIDKE